MSESLPRGWVTASLGDLCDEKVEQAPPTEKPVPYIDIGSIDRSTKRVAETTLVTIDDAPSRARQWVRGDDVLVSMTRPNLNAVAQVGPDLDGAVASTGFDVLRPRASDSRWIFYRVRTNEFVADVCEDLQGVVYPAIRPHDVRRHELPLPPLAEQRRIVEEIESYFTRLDDAVATLDRVQRNLKRYRASVLKAAVEGRLVPTEAELARAEGRSYEPASVLLEHILAGRRRHWEEGELAKMKAKGKAPKDDSWKGKYVEPAAPDTSELPELPEGWCWASCEQALLRLQTGPFGSTLHKADYVSGGTPIINPQHLRDYDIHPSEQAGVGPETLARLSGFALAAGDVVLARRGEMGRCALVGEREQGWLLGTGSLALRFAKSINRAFVTWVMRSPRTVRTLEGESVGTTMTNLNQEILFGLPIPLAPLAEQVRIVQEIARHYSLIEVVESTTTAQKERCSRLRQSILKWAFEGRLVDQDPSDEPASVLIERIRAEREAAHAGAPSRRPSTGTKRRGRNAAAPTAADGP